jgi:hypothetical protein
MKNIGKFNKLIKSMKYILFVFISFALLGCYRSLTDFDDIQINKEYYHYLVSNPVIMKSTGVKVINDKPLRRTIIIAVESVMIEKDTPAEKLKAEKVCRIKALSRLTTEKYGVQIFHYESLEEKTTQLIDNTIESESSTSELITITNARTNGTIKNAKTIGHWFSKDRTIYYLALGITIRQN